MSKDRLHLDSIIIADIALSSLQLINSLIASISFLNLHLQSINIQAPINLELQLHRSSDHLGHIKMDRWLHKVNK